MASRVSLLPMVHVVPRTIGAFSVAGARHELAPAFVNFRSGRQHSATWNKGHLFVPSCSAGRLMNGVKVSGEANTEKPIVVIDNYDSFTYNLCQYVGELGSNFKVYRNDELTVEELKRMKPRGILISPGPGEPKESGISLQTVIELGPSIPLLGVCMGLQCIGEAFGGKIVRSPYGVVHGKSALIYYEDRLEETLFSGLSNPFTAARYHSLVIEKDSFPDDTLEITAWTGDGLIMAARHKKHKHIKGVQFHPESVLTTEGKKIIRNFLILIQKFEAGEL